MDAPAAVEEHRTSTGLSNVKIAMWAFLASDCLLFGALISTFLLYHGQTGTGPTPSELYDIPFTSVSSFVLLMSSLTMVLALAAMQRGEEHRARAWMVATALLGLTFLSGQVYEFTTFVHEGAALTTSPFTSSFFLMTGFHGAHVAGGVLLLLTLTGMSLDGRLPSHRSETVEMAGLYWHFVDVVWIVIFAVAYLIPHGEVGATMESEATFPIDRAAHTSEAEELSHHPTPRKYVLIAVVLAVATAMEVLLYYLELPRTLLIVLLLIFAVVKFGLVVLYFMHLKFDSRLFRRMFFTGLILALIVYTVVLIIFGVLRP